MNYTANVKLPLEEFRHINALLGIESIPALPIDTIEALNVEPNTGKLLFSASFENGVALDLYLYSGMENYYTAPEFQMPNGSILSPEGYAGFSLNHKEVFTLRENTYTIIIDAGEQYENWVVLAKDDNGKIHFYRRVTEGPEQFVSDVRLLPGLTTLSIYREKDVVEDRTI